MTTRVSFSSSVSHLRKHATSILLVTAAIGLGVYVWMDRNGPTAAELEARKANLLPAFRSDDVREIAIEHSGKSALFVRTDREDAGEPVFAFVEAGMKTEEAPSADPGAVERLLQALERAVPIRKLEENSDVTSTGLDASNVRLTVRMRSNTVRIVLGDEAKTPIGSRYALLEGSGVFVLSRSSADDLMRPIDAYRTRRVVPYVASELDSIVLRSGEGSVRLDRGPWGGFRVDSEVGKPRVSQGAFDRLLRAFADANAERFLEAEVASRAIADAKRVTKLVLTPKSGPVAELVVGGDCQSASDATVDAGVVVPSALPSTLPKLVVVVRTSPSPLFACVPSSVLDDLQLSSRSLVDHGMLRTSVDEVEEIKVVRGDARMELARSGTGWHARLPVERDIPAEDMAGYLAALVSVEGQLSEDDGDPKRGLSPPRGTLTIQQPSLGSTFGSSLGTTDVPSQVVEFGNEETTQDGARIWVRRKDDGAVLSVQASLVAPLFEASLAWVRSTELLKVSSLRMKLVQVSIQDQKQQVIERRGPGFSMIEPKGYPVDVSLAADLFDAVSTVRAERWVADRDDGAFGLSPPKGTVALTFEGDKGEEKRTLLLGNETTDGRFGRWEQDTGVFVLSRAFDTALRTYAVDRLVFMVDPAEVQSVMIRAGDRDVRIGATGDFWKSSGGTLHPMQEGNVVRVRRALTELRAEGVVMLGAMKDSDADFSKPLLRIEIESRPDVRKSRAVILVSRGDVWRTTNVYYARKQGVDAVYAIAQSRVKPLLEAMGIQ